MPKHIDRAAEMVTSLTIDLSRALDNFEHEITVTAALKIRCAEHIRTIEAKCAEIRCLREKIERLENEVAMWRKQITN